MAIAEKTFLSPVWRMRAQLSPTPTDAATFDIIQPLRAHTHQILHENLTNSICVYRNIPKALFEMEKNLFTWNLCHALHSVQCSIPCNLLVLKLSIYPNILWHYRRCNLRYAWIEFEMMKNKKKSPSQHNANRIWSRLQTRCWRISSLAEKWWFEYQGKNLMNIS